MLSPGRPGVLMRNARGGQAQVPDILCRVRKWLPVRLLVRAHIRCARCGGYAGQWLGRSSCKDIMIQFQLSQPAGADLV